MNTTLIVDLSSHSVGVGILYKGKSNELPSLVYTHREYVSYESKPTAKEIHIKVKQLLDSILTHHVQKYLKEKKGHSCFRDVYVVHSLAWAFSTTRHIDISHDKEIVVTKEYISKLTYDTAAKSADLSGMKLVSQNISNVRLNGYKIDNPWGKKTNRLVATASETYIDQVMVEIVERSVNSCFRSKVKHITENEASYKALCYKNSGLLNTAMIHISGETTEIFLVREGLLMNAVSVPYGVNSLCRIIAKEDSSHSEIAFSHIVSSIEENRSFNKREKEIFDREVAVWRGSIWKAIQSLSEGGVLPSSIHLVSLPHYKAIARKICDASAFTLFSQKDHIVTSVYEEPEHRELYSVNKDVVRDPLITIALISYLN